MDKHKSGQGTPCQRVELGARAGHTALLREAQTPSPGGGGGLEVKAQ